jgi:hypothetical protein
MCFVSKVSGHTAYQRTYLFFQTDNIYDFERYRKDVDGADDDIPSPTIASPKASSTFVSIIKQSVNQTGLKMPTDFSSSYTDYVVTIYCKRSFYCR